MFCADTGTSLGHVHASGGACQDMQPSKSQSRVLCQHAKQARLATQDREVHHNIRQDANVPEAWQPVDIPPCDVLPSHCTGPVDDLYPAVLLPAAYEQQPLN